MHYLQNMIEREMKKYFVKSEVIGLHNDKNKYFCPL